MNTITTRWAGIALYTISGVIVAVFLIYWAAFYALAERIALTSLHNLADRGYSISAQVKPGGFPIRPTLSGHIHLVTPDRGVDVTIPDFTARGFFIPHTAMHIAIPKGMHVTGPRADAIWPEWRNIQSLAISFRKPAAIAAGMAPVPIDRFDLQIDQSRFIGAGTIWLDDQAQPAGAMTMQIINAAHILRHLQDNNAIDAQSAALIAMALRGFEFTDPDTNARMVSVPLSVNERRVYAGPFALWQIPVLDMGGLVSGLSATGRVRQ